MEPVKAGIEIKTSVMDETKPIMDKNIFTIGAMDDNNWPKAGFILAMVKLNKLHGHNKIGRARNTRPMVLLALSLTEIK